MKDLWVECTTCETVGPDIVLLGLRPLKGSWPATQPGQFFMLAVPEGGRCFSLRRPFSLYEQRGDEGLFLFRRMGYGTTRLGTMSLGARTRALGPLGQPFPLPPTRGPVLLISGGLGMATLFAWHRVLAQQGFSVIHLYAARTASQLVRRDALERLGGQVYYATDDGSFGWAGRVDHVLVERFEELGAPWVAVYVCGPTVMMEAVYRRLRRRWTGPLWTAMEAPMGCGFGVCRGCAIPVRGTPVRYRMACLDGPVFPADEVEWTWLL